MKYTEYHYLNGCSKATLTIDVLDFLEFKPDEFSRLLFKECESSGSIADKLLALECVARRLEETKKVKSEVCIHHKIV